MRLLRYIGIIFSLYAGIAVAESPLVVVTIPPIASVAAALLVGVAEPAVLLKTANSAHQLSLTPQDRVLLGKATYVVWMGPALESHLVPVIKALPPEKVYTVLETPKLGLLESRHLHAQEATQGLQADPHVWLDPQKMIVISQQLLARFLAVYPEHTALLQHNYLEVVQRLETLDKDLKQKLSRKLKMWSYHDSLQYLEKAYRLKAITPLVIHEEMPPPPQTLATLQKAIKAGKVDCFLQEPEYPAQWQKTLAPMVVPVYTLDLMGTTLTGPLAEQYFSLMQGVETVLQQCAQK